MFQCFLLLAYLKQTLSLTLHFKHWSVVLHHSAHRSKNLFHWPIPFPLRFLLRLPLITTLNSITRITVEVTCSVLILFFVYFSTPAFNSRFNSIELPVKSLHSELRQGKFQRPKQIMASTKLMPLWRTSALRTPQLLKSENPALHNLRTKQICQVFRAIMAINTNLLKSRQMRELFFHLFCDRNSPFTWHNFVWSF